LSVDAVHDKVSDVCVAELVPSPAGVVGDCVSGQAFVAWDMLAVLERLPAAS
jgi:hypothetical protein